MRIDDCFFSLANWVKNAYFLRRRLRSVLCGLIADDGVTILRREVGGVRR